MPLNGHKSTLKTLFFYMQKIEKCPIGAGLRRKEGVKSGRKKASPPAPLHWERGASPEMVHRM
jgi:hypothetical protein